MRGRWGATSRKVTRPCERCGAPVTRYQSQVALGRGRFCSKTCANVSRDKRPLSERFWEKVDKNGPVVRPDLGPCWIWTDGTGDRGYGRFGIWQHGKTVVHAAHRVAFELEVRPLEQDECALHRCDNPPCVRPDHLFAGTVLDNNADMKQKKRHAFGEKNGHAQLTAEQVIDARSRYIFRKVTFVQLGNEYGVRPQAVRAAVNGKTWRHL